VVDGASRVIGKRALQTARDLREARARGVSDSSLAEISRAGERILAARRMLEEIKGLPDYEKRERVNEIMGE
jgi:hypothetical protein